ncbi:MAG: glycoside hydrolase family 36 protein [Planctomycetota bacterium]|jgi:alpha-galactosidase
MMVRLEADLGPFHAELSCEEDATPGIFSVHLTVSAATAHPLPTLNLKWDLPAVDFHYKWNSRCSQNRALDPSSGSENYVKSHANSGMPVYSLYNLEGINTCTWALSDAIHNTSLGGSFSHGMLYHSSAVIHGETIGTVSDYVVLLRFDFRRRPVHSVLRDVACWWEAMAEYKPCVSPEAVRMPVLSTWYSYTLNLDLDDLEKQCALAKDMGIDTVILDDGWQTAQIECGYQNNGDWEVNEDKLPGFAAHVKRVQALGMKYMVWFSVPFVGVESKAYERFKDMLMPGREGAKWYSFDPRFIETREYLAQTYEQFLHRYGIDGFKMDFIAAFGGGSIEGEKPDDRRDCVSVAEGVCKLLDDVMGRLRAINPEIMIEFRQPYTGPAMRRYGNIFRAIDCPNSIGDNRVRSLDVRLLCGDTVVHADPITWHNDDPAPSAAMQILHALFSVPQISRKVTELSESHQRMLRQQMAFCREHRDVLLAGEFRPLHPHQLFPLVVAKNKSKLLVAYYAEMPFRLDESVPEQLILVNGSYAKELLLDLTAPLGPCHLTVTSCTGVLLTTEEVDLTVGLNRISVPAAASAVIRKR